MKRLTLTLTAFLMLVFPLLHAQDVSTNELNAQQVAKLDLNGKWTGTRKQYSWDKKSFIETFQYEFDLKQEGDIVTGTSTILTENGEYADMKLQGVVVGNKLHFREYQVEGAIRPEGMVWCFKSGELHFVKVGDNLELTGATPSYTEIYNYPCSGGLTELTKVDNSPNLTILNTVTPTTSKAITEDIDVRVFPNPFIDNTAIYYSITNDAKVKVEIFDLSGKLISTLFEGNEKAGTYHVSFDGKNSGNQSGIYIAKLSVNNEVYSKQLVQMH